MPIIFRKTAKGLTEIETRAHRLPPRMRSTLILVDGKRDADDLKALISQQPEETLQSLADQGFIEAVGETLGIVVKPATAVPAALRTPAPKPALDFPTRRRMVVRALNDELGPPAESLAMRMERANNADELKPLLAQAVQLVLTARGRAASEAFAARVQAN